MSVYNKLKRNIQLLVNRAVVSIVNDSLKTQNLQITLLEDEVADNVERFQNYGHTSVPPAGSQAIVLSVGAVRQHQVAVVVDNPATRLNNLKSGDSALYHKDGHRLLLTENGEARLTCKRFIVEADAAVFDVLETRFSGNVSILGNVTTTGSSVAADHVSGGISGKAHKHRHGEPYTGVPE